MNTLYDKTIIKKCYGYCTCCNNYTSFTSKNSWLRDFYLCDKCGSIPRERHLAYIIEQIFPDYSQIKIHESSPGSRGISEKLRKHCVNYLPSQYFSDNICDTVNGIKNIDLQKQNFEDQVFDLVITQDVFEHIPQPKLAIREIQRTLKPGGYMISTIPLVNKFNPTEQRARYNNNKIEYLYEAEYHGNPIDEKGSLVFWHYGYDIASKFIEWSGMETIIVNNVIPHLGIEAEYLEVVICKKANI